MKKLLLVLAVILALALFVDAYAQTEPVSPLTNIGTYSVRSLSMERDAAMFDSPYLEAVNADSNGYEDTPGDKMGIGIINAATSWTELPRQVARVSEEDNALAGWTWGFGEGVVSGLARGVSGALDLATFGLPPYDEPLMQPEYKVQQPQEEGLKINLLSW